jgi:hypothetical protein
LEQIKTIEEVRELHGEELREYLVSLPLEERRRIISELLEARGDIDEPNDDLPDIDPN